MYVYVDGKFIVLMDIVIGKFGKYVIIMGVWYIWNKEKNVIFKGDNDDGLSYF